VNWWEFRAKAEADGWSADCCRVVAVALLESRLGCFGAFSFCTYCICHFGHSIKKSKGTGVE